MLAIGNSSLRASIVIFGPRLHPALGYVPMPGDPNQPRLRGPVPGDSPLDVYRPAIYHVFFLECGIRS